MQIRKYKFCYQIVLKMEITKGQECLQSMFIGQALLRVLCGVLISYLKLESEAQRVTG